MKTHKAEQRASEILERAELAGFVPCHGVFVVEPRLTQPWDWEEVK